MEEVKVGYQWVKTNDGAEILVNIENKKVYAYISNFSSLKVRIFNSPRVYKDLEILKAEDWRNPIGSRHSPDGDYNDVESGKNAIEKELKIVIIEEKQDILKFLAKLQNVEVFGKIELVIRIEGWNPDKEEK